jgi:hypothetical protein
MTRTAQASRAELLEVLGFDLLAQAEAMLRHTRAYLREVQRLRREVRKQQTPSAGPIDGGLHAQVARLQTAGSTFQDTVKSIKEAAGRPARENAPPPRRRR